MIYYDDLLKQCKHLDSVGDYAAAIALLTQSLVITPSAFLYYERGSRFEELGYYDMANDDYSNAIQLEPNSKYLIARGLLLSRRLQDDYKALSDFQRATIADHYNHTIYACIALSSLALGRVHEAIINAKTAVRLAPDNGTAYSCLGQCFFAAGMIPEAVDNLIRATELLPDSANSWSMLSRAYRKMGNLNEAQQCIENSLKLERSPVSLINYGSILLESDKPELAVVVFEEILMLPLADAERHLASGYLNVAHSKRSR